MRFSHRAAGVASVAVLALALAACGSASPSSSAKATSPATTGLKTKSTSIGTVLAAPSGHTVYELVGATPTHSPCTGGCLAIWPPVKANGHQVVIKGHPAYTFSGDNAPGQVNGQGLKDKWGKWWVLDPTGTPITKTKSSSTTTTSGSSGYGY
ncbi:MAG: COG4315 family predicted lipoprotein [Acidimicrobiales bacterium]